MKYRDFCGEKVSVLGFGGMRFPLCEDEKIDREQSKKMLMKAYENGVNYFDTAYFYHKQESEDFFGEALEGVRKNVFIATKAPVYAMEKEEDFYTFFENQLKRLRTDYVDFYLLHALDKDSWENKVKKFDVIPKLAKLKEEGKVKHIGFSFHDSIEVFKEIVDYYDGWDFCQIQYNYIDIEKQAGKEGLEYAKKKGLDLVIMEPLLGGKLATPPEMVKIALDSSKTPVEWALDFLWNHEEISILLSGMSTMEQVEDNLKFADSAKVGMLSQKDIDMLMNVRKVYLTNAFVPCTKCQYCMPCPAGLNIPEIYEAYNSTVSKGKEKAKEIYEALEHKASECIDCKACQKACPQGIDPSDYMGKIASVFE